MIKSTTINQQGIEWVFQQPYDIKLQVLSNHLEICKAVINSLLQSSVTELAGERYSHCKPEAGRYSRWGSNRGSVRIGNQKLSVSVPRVYDSREDTVGNVPVYNEVKDLPEQKEEMIASVLKGISMRDYSQVATQLLESFGLSASSISRHFIERSRQAVKEFCERRWEHYDFVALFIDGKSFQKEQMIIVLGITADGIKIPVSVLQTATENSRAIAQMLRDLIERGFQYEEGILVVTDGSKGLIKAVTEVFAQKAVMQRCQWHKRENVVSYLAESQQEIYRSLLQDAYKENEYATAKVKLQEIVEKLKPINLQASRSLEEGLEETLTLHRLGLVAEFGKSFSTTNCIESINSQVEKYTRKVKNWMNSDQRYRWVIMALMEIEKSLHKVKGYKKIHLLKQAIKNEITKKINEINFFEEETVKKISTKNAT